MSKDQALQFHANKAFERLNSAAQVYQRGENALGLMEDAAESVLILRSGIDALAGQRDEGLAREAELRAENAALRELHCHAFEQSQDLSRERDTLQQHLAEAEKQRDALQVWERFAGYLLDNCEGQTVYEESLQYWLSEMIRKEREASPGCANGEKP